MVRIPVSLCFFAVLLSSVTSFADDAVNVRASAKDDYTRIVFEWSKPPSYVTDKTASTLSLKFQSAATFKTDGNAPNTLPRITSYSTPDAKTALIGFAPGQDVRHFEIGNKVIVDIRGPVAPVTKPAAAAKPPEAKPDIKPEAIKPDVKHISSEIKTGSAAPVKKVETVGAVPAPAGVMAADSAKATVAAEATAPGLNTIQITATDSIGLAVFKRFGNLWIVVDVPDYPIAPQISGVDAKKFGSFERIALKEATAFRIAVPDDRLLHVEGGGLVWKIIFDGKAAVPAPTDFKRMASADKKASLLWPVPTVRRVIDLNDPVVGDMLKVATVDSGKFFAGSVHDFSEFESLQSFAGLAIESHIDDLKVTKNKDGILIEGKDGLAISPESDFIAAKPPAPPVVAQASVKVAAAAITAPVAPNMFHFSDWQMGDAKAVEDNRRILMSGLGVKPDGDKAKDLLTLAKMELAHGRGPEASGYLDLASQFVPDLATSPEFLALHGASSGLSGEYETALKDFSADALKSSPEINMWKSYTLANLEDWPQAAASLPSDFSTLSTYPDAVKVPIALTLTEVALRNGDLGKAHQLMDIAAIKNPILPYQSALDYMKGEAARQEGKPEEAEKLWTALKDGKDNLYRAKAGLALTALQLDRKEIKPDEAIDRLEGLRYAWRGDELETSINYKLGQMYIANNDPLKGLALLRQAASLSPDSDQGRRISSEMGSTFSSIFEPNRIKDVNPVDAISIYNEFSGLVPKGPAGQKIVRQLADRLADADLLPRAAGLLEKQMASGELQGEEAATTAIHLASIYNQDNKPDKALDALNKAISYLPSVPADSKLTLQRQISLIKAEALGLQKKPEEAFTILAGLPQNQEVLRLRADIAWKSQRWQDAADSLEGLVKLKDVSATRPASDEDANLLLNWAVALYLADNRFVLTNLREKYSSAMAANPKANQFEVVTRPRQSSQLSDTDSINSIIEETDIFKGFVDSSRAANKAADVAATQAPAKTVNPITPAQPPVTVPPTAPANAGATSSAVTQ